MALFYNFRKKIKPTEQVKQSESIYTKPRFDLIQSIRETDFGFARLCNISKYHNSLSGLLIINPQYIFPNDKYQSFNPITNRYGDGLIISGDYVSEISNIQLDITITENHNSYYSHYDYDYQGRPMYRETEMLTYHRQVFANAFDGIVTQTGESFLTDNKYKFKSRVSSNIVVTNLEELRYQISMLVDRAKLLILEDFIKEINKSKLIETKDKFFQQLSKDVMNDIFGHISDVVPESELIIGNQSIKFHIPIVGKNTHKDLRVSFVFDDKTSTILYELGECQKRILGYCSDCQTTISFSEKGIILTILPHIDAEIIKNEEIHVRNHYPASRVRNHYTDWNL